MQRRRQHTEAFPAHTPGRTRPRAGARAGGGGPAGYISPGQPGKVSRLPRALRPPTSGVHSKDLSRKDAAKLLWGAETRRAERAERPSGWPARSPEVRPAPALSLPSSGPREMRAPGPSAPPWAIRALSLRRSEEPHPDLCGRAAGSFQPRRQSLASSGLSLKASLRLPAGDETEVSLPTHPDDNEQRGRKEERKKRIFFFSRKGGKLAPTDSRSFRKLTGPSRRAMETQRCHLVLLQRKMFSFYGFCKSIGF